MRFFSSLSLTCLLVLAFVPNAKAADKAQRTWQSMCSSCHGEDGKGQTGMGKQMGLKDFSTSSWQKGVTNSQIQIAIEDGKSGLKSGKMSSYKVKLKPDQIADLVKYIRTLAK